MVQRSSCIRNLVQSLRAASFPSKLADYLGNTSQAASSLGVATQPSAYSDEEYVDVDWDKLGFGFRPVDYMYVMRCSKAENFREGRLSRYGNIELSPSAGVLNYGQGILEGTKANRTEDGRILLFRPEQNAARMRHGAERMCMPSPSIEQFVDAVKETVLANKRWIPPPGKGSLYVRPLLLGTGPILGLAPAPEYTFLIYASPVCNYFKDGTAPLNLFIDEEFVRASPGGAGGVKTITNYAPVLKAIVRAKNRGFSDVLYLDAMNRKYLEEVSSCNVFVVKGNLISTPAINGTVLEGVTRKSILEIARDHGYQVEERVISVDDLVDADEVFCTGTAVGVAPVGSITHQNRRIEFKSEGSLVCQELYSTLVGLQTGRIEDKKGWTVQID
ncbi:branched-chain amino acid aminotransferase 1, mitochondrial-like isoform X2 [Durio zibethinus]|uniref:Branched-chain-amino-acid aminotransferase n=1 Tax=Durio zibethinus TaxID=66656 RepID=A0A6P6AUJ9_DURZI|nr:branched-chain amino acid aminotransferase 1, mitochondrial-like isoform X2 [Durio zibethinus]